MERLHEFEIRMRKFDKYCYLIASLLFFIFSVILEMESFALSGIFFIQPVLVLGLMKLFRDSRKFRVYFLHRASKYNTRMNLKNEIWAFILIIIEAAFIRNITWYNVIIVIILGMVFEYLRNLVKVEQNFIIE